MSKETNSPNKERACCRKMREVFVPPFFKALGDPTRVALLVYIAGQEGPCTVSQVSEYCPCDISVVSRHLATLRDAGILEARKRGREVYYAIRYPELARSLREMADAIDACCPPESGCDC